MKQGDILAPILFKLALEKVARIIQNNEWGLLINQKKIKLLGFADDLDIIGESFADISNAVRELEGAMKKIGLEINMEKTKIIELIESEEDSFEIRT